MFEGTGTASIAALLEGRNVTCVDFCPEMVDAINSRVSRFLDNEYSIAKKIMNDLKLKGVKEGEELTDAQKKIVEEQEKLQDELKERAADPDVVISEQEAEQVLNISKQYKDDKEFSDIWPVFVKTCMTKGEWASKEKWRTRDWKAYFGTVRKSKLPL